ncbi:MAG: ComF family protein [Gammaproteobacteria bacterium]|nr:ComF family protein [Gammaproteobacteria bacterium]
MGEPYHAFSVFRGERRIARKVCAGNNDVMLLRAFDKAVMPLRCVFCGTQTSAGEHYICVGCDADLPRVESPPPPAASPCAYEIAPLAYEFPVDAAIKALKFRRKLFYAPALAQILCDACSALPSDIDAVLPVPLHWRRRWFRGFNQALEIARPVARHLDVPIVTSVVRKRATRSQSGLSARQRASNLRAGFGVRGTLESEHLLIVDDVITTGATIHEIARVVRGAGVLRISALAAARA